MIRTALLAAAGALAGCGGGSTEAPTCWPDDAPALAFTELELPGDEVGITGVVFVPDSDELLVLSKSGRVSHYRQDGDELELLGELVLPEVRNTNDCGLISAAFGAATALGRELYLAHCLPDDMGRANRIVRLDFQPPDYAATLASLEITFEVTDPDIRAGAASHTLGRLHVDGDGVLWAPMGDRGVEERARDPGSHLGKILRIAGGEVEVYALGLRNPWTATLDHLGRLWVGDVGSDEVEEINVVTGPGEDFGWDTHEGPCGAGCGDTIGPALSWSRSSGHAYVQADPDATPTPNRVAWVGPEYRGGPEDRYDGLLDDAILFGDSCVGFLRAARLADDGTICDGPVGHLSNVVDMRQGPDGYLYAVSFGTCNTGDPITPGRLWRAELAL